MTGLSLSPVRMASPSTLATRHRPGGVSHPKDWDPTEPFHDTLHIGMRSASRTSLDQDTYGGLVRNISRKITSGIREQIHPSHGRAGGVAHAPPAQVF